MPSSGLQGYCIHIVHKHALRQTTDTHKIKGTNEWSRVAMHYYENISYSLEHSLDLIVRVNETT